MSSSWSIYDQKYSCSAFLRSRLWAQFFFNLNPGSLSIPITFPHPHSYTFCVVKQSYSTQRVRDTGKISTGRNDNLFSDPTSVWQTKPKTEFRASVKLFGQNYRKRIGKPVRSTMHFFFSFYLQLIGVAGSILGFSLGDATLLGAWFAPPNPNHPVAALRILLLNLDAMAYAISVRTGTAWPSCA